MAVLHYGMMRATALMNKELDAAGGTAIDAAGDKRDLTAAEREAANVRACRLAGAISRMSATCQQGRLSACGRALRPWLGRTLLLAAVLDPSGQASLASVRP